MNRIRIFRESGIFKGYRIFRVSGIIQALSLMLFLLILTACEHKELRYVTSSFRSLRVEFNWERYEDFQKPEGMRVVFFPKDGTSEPWIFDFPNRLTALLDKWLNAVLLNLLLAIQAQQLLNLQLNRQTVGIPTRHIRCTKAAHVLILNDKVF